MIEIPERISIVSREQPVQGVTKGLLEALLR